MAHLPNFDQTALNVIASLLKVDNPIAVLNQDTAKTFLFKCDPDKLYTFFMRATQVEFK